MITRVAFFIDGFNLYHSLKEYAPDCRWLNLRKLCETYINPQKEYITDIYYFSALATHKSVDNIYKHQKYIARLKAENIIPILGKFKRKDKICPVCKSAFISHEEKQTDVNIALKIVAEGILGKYDTGILVSGDTDMIPAIQTIKILGLPVRIGVLFPLGRKTKELENYADFSIKIKEKELRASLFEASTSPQGWVPVK
ncbi:MAG: NYN domain-containing protein [Spirochaetia bacterium]|nr:NYN domain-containing protein [Spirochaetia bacterium]